MKKFTKLAALAASIATLFLAGCSNISTDTATVEGVTKGNIASLTLNVSSDSELISFNTPVEDNSRSILPTAYKAGDVKFYLCSKSTNEENYTKKPVEVVFTGTKVKDANDKNPEDQGYTPTYSATNGTVVINLAQGAYDFELYAVKTSVATSSGYASRQLVKDAACLMATAQADLRYAQPVDFFLTSDGLSKAGSVNLKLYALGWNPDDYVGYDVKAALYYTKPTLVGQTLIPAGNKVDSTEKTLVNATETGTLTISSGIPQSASTLEDGNYKLNSVAAGTYLFEVTFQKVGTETVFYWNDDIKILPDAATEVEVGITPTIDLPPAAPTGFKAGYIDDLSNEYYDLEFVWDASAINNESNFKIELLSITDAVQDASATHPTTDGQWTTIEGITTDASVSYDNNFVGNKFVYKKGSLGKNSQYAVFIAAYGKRYVARICSVNDIGTSEWVYCDIASGIEANPSTGAVEATGFKSSTINRYKVTYNLSNGTLKDASDKAIPNVYGCSQLFVASKEETEGGTTSPYFDSTGKHFFYDDKADGSGELTGVEIMSPSGENDFNWDDKGTKKTVTKPVLALNASQKWTNWTLDGVNYNEIGSLAKPYGGFKNLNLVANYATLATVTLLDDKDYAIASVSSTKEFTADDKVGHYCITLAQDSDTSVVWQIVPATGIIYDYVTVTLYKTSNQKDYYTVPVVYDAQAKVYKATLTVASFRTGIYHAVIAANSSIRQDPYTAQVGVTVVDTDGSTPAAPTVQSIDTPVVVAAAGGALSVTPPDVTMTSGTFNGIITYKWEESSDSTDGTDGSWSVVNGQTGANLVGTSNNWYRVTASAGGKTSSVSAATQAQ